MMATISLPGDQRWGEAYRALTSHRLDHSELYGRSGSLGAATMP